MERIETVLIASDVGQTRRAAARLREWGFGEPRVIARREIADCALSGGFFIDARDEKLTRETAWRVRAVLECTGKPSAALCEGKYRLPCAVPAGEKPKGALFCGAAVGVPAKTGELC